MADSYDVIVIGGGPGGYVAAIRSAQLGLKTAVVEKDKPGGRCLNYACIPAKTMLHTAELLDHAQNSAELGVKVKDASLDWEALAERRAKVSETLSGGVKMLWDKNKVTWIQGEGSLDADANVVVGNETHEAKAVVLATGSVALAIPGAEFSERVVDTWGAWSLPKLPTKIAVVGAGASGAEIASAYIRYGVEVILVEMLDQILPAEDKDVVRVVERTFKKQGIEVLTGTPISDVDAGAKSVKAKIGEQAIEVDYLCIAGGRDPDTEGLGLDAAGVATGDGGKIEIDEVQRTSNPKVYAIGDLVRGAALAHKAMEEGVVAVETVAGAPTHPVDPDLVAGRDLLPPSGGERRDDRGASQGGRQEGEGRPLQARSRRRGHRLRRSRRDRQDRRRLRVRGDRRSPRGWQPRLRHDRRARRHDRARGRLPGARSDRARTSDDLRGGARRGPRGRRLGDPPVAP